MLEKSEILEREKLVALAQSMLDGKLSFFEGALLVTSIRNQLSGIVDRDPDFDAFVVIKSETDHLPTVAQRSLWSPIALVDIESEIREVEVWAKSFAPQACKNLIARFSDN